MVDIIVDVLTVIKESHLQVKIFTAIIWSPNCTQEMASYIIDMKPVPSFLNKNIQHFCLYPVCLAVKWLFGEETSPLLSLPTPRGGRDSLTHSSPQQELPQWNAIFQDKVNNNKTLQNAICYRISAIYISSREILHLTDHQSMY